MYTFDDIALEQWQVGGLDTRVASVGKGPVALFIHGWPECWYSWREQMVLLANAGYRSVAPDMPGFGHSQGLPGIADYNIARISEFLLQLIAEAGDSPVLLIGHDWGAINAWNFTLRHPEAVSRLVTMSVPLRKPGDQPPTEQLRRIFGDRFFYQLYFQTPGVAEAEFDANPEGILRALLCSPDTPRATPRLGKPISEGGGWTDRLGAPLEQPEWLSDEALAYYVASYKHSGFAGGINYYRNLDHNWQLMQPYQHSKVHCPVLFLAGSEDIATQRATHEQLQELMAERVPDLTIEVYPGLGHWLQSEATEQVNEALLTFLQR